MEDVQATIEKLEMIKATKKKSLTRDDIMRL